MKFKKVLFFITVFIFIFGFFGIKNTNAVDTITSAGYQDLDYVGKINNIFVTLDEGFVSCDFEVDDWVIVEPGDVGLSEIQAISCRGGESFLMIQVVSNNFVTGGLVDPVITYTQAAGTVVDSVVLASGPMTDKSITISDLAGPMVDPNRVTYLDLDEDGTVDTIEIGVYPDLGLSCGNFTAGTDFVINTAGTVNLTESVTDTCTTDGTSYFRITLGTLGEEGITGGEVEPTFNYFQPITNDGFQDAQANSMMIDEEGGSQTEFTLIDGASPLITSVTLSDYSLTIGETATVTFISTEELVGFAKADVSAPNGTLSDITGDAGGYTATFTPASGVRDNTNIMTVGTGYTDLAGNPAIAEVSSSNYEVSTRISRSRSSGSFINKNLFVPVLIDDANDCLTGYKFSPSTGKPCASVVNPGVGHAYAFGNTLIKMGDKGEACRAWQMFLNEKTNADLVTDGWCGNLTMTKAKLWQASVGLVADGLLGPASRTKANMQ